MAHLILADRSDGRIIAGLVTSLIFHWNRLPIGLQTAIISHASETGFGISGLSVQADERIVSFIRTHHQAVRREAPDRTWAPRRLWLAWLRRRHLVNVVDVEMPAGSAASFRRSWAERRDAVAARRDSRRTITSEVARGIDRARKLLKRRTT